MASEDEEEFSLISGWLMVSEGDPMADGGRGWHAGYCVARPKERSLICYRWEPILHFGDRKIRLDGGRTAFSNYWNIRLTPQRPLGGFHTVGRSATRRPREEELNKSRSWFATVRSRKTRNHDDACESLERRAWSTAMRSAAGPSLLTSRAGSAHNLNASNNSNYNGEHFQEDTTAPQRIANFLSKPFRTNPLKRTKSVSKLEKNQQGQQVLHRVDAQRSQENLLGLSYGSRGFSTTSSASREQPSIRSSRSHESLLNFGATTHMIDLGEPTSRAHQVHPSVLDTPNCFRVANTYYACRTPQERNRWMENLRRIMNPRQEHQRRVERSLQLWILEAKGIPSKKRYFCDICLDQKEYGRTTSKPRTDNVFWGEYFDFNELQSCKVLCINVHREGELKKKKGPTLIGFVKIDIDQINSRHPVERWYTVTHDSGNRLANALGSKNNTVENPAIRIKARWQQIDILPLKVYAELQNFLTYNYLPLCAQLEPILSVKAKEDLATSLVRFLHSQKMAKYFLCDLVMSEINLLDNDHLMFRGNSLATKAMEAYMKLVADDYLQDTLGDIIRELLASNESCEVDPLKLSAVSQNILEKNRALLMHWVEKAWNRIIMSQNVLPYELRDVFCAIRERLDQEGRGSLADTLISSSIFLRYLCPAILSPSLFNLCAEYPCGMTARNLTLIAKTLQNLANFTKFGGKEHYMEFMNSFVEREWNGMKDFLFRISTSPYGRPNGDIFVNVGRELSLLNTYLEEAWTAEIHERARQDHRLVDLREILLDLREHRRRSLPQSPLVHQGSSDYDNSPQHMVVRGRSENLPAYRSTPPTGQATVITRNRPAAHLMTSDDYVTSAALATTNPNSRMLRLSDEMGTTSSTSEKTSSSGEARDTDSEGEMRLGRPRTRKSKKRLEGSDTGSLPPSSGYHSNNISSYSTSASSSPVERVAAVSISNPSFSPMKEIQVPGPSGYNANYGTYEPYRRASPPPYHADMHDYAHSIYAIPPDCETSPLSSKTAQPRTNPRASRGSAVLRPTIVDIDMSNDKISSPSRRQSSAPGMSSLSPEELIAQQRREIARLMRENEELKRHLNGTNKSKIPLEKVSDSGASEESYDSLSSLDRVRKSVVPC